MDLGFHQAGHRTIGFCEWDEWRRRVLAARWPGVPIHHDLAELADWCEADPAAVIDWLGGQPDLLIGGTPCQDLSVAGQRAGLDGERSGLYWAYQRVRLALGIEWACWENVAGALSSNDGVDFASVLGAFVGADVSVSAEGWGGAGVVAGPWGGAVWRLLDAQHFGVPQRRRRIFVVGRLGGACPPEVLLELAGSGGNHASRRGEGPRVAAPLTRGSSRPGVSEPGRRQEDDINIVAARGSNGDIARSLLKSGGHSKQDDTLDTYVVAATLRASVGGGGGGQKDNNLVAAPILKRHGKGVDSDVSDGQLVTHTLRAAGFDASEDGTRRGTPLTVVGGVVDNEGERVDGTPVDSDRVRAADGLARRLDVAGGLTKNIAKRGSSTEGIGTFVADGDVPGSGMSSAYDPQPDGRRYAACGDGVVAPVAEWIGRRLAAVAEIAEAA